MKKTLSLFLLVLLCLIMSACGGNSKFKSANIGDYIKIGAYEQDGDDANGKEAIQWLVLDKKDGRILVISKYAIDCKPYDKRNENITWEKSTLREWLNNDFIDKAFSEEEKSAISTVNIIAERNPEYNIDAGNDSEDKVFLLSIDEANKYFDSNSERSCVPTEYAVDHKADTYSNGNCVWWLRTPGGRQDFAAFVNYDGDVGDLAAFGGPVAYDNFAVRPAMWIEID